MSELSHIISQHIFPSKISNELTANVADVMWSYWIWIVIFKADVGNNSLICRFSYNVDTLEIVATRLLIYSEIQKWQ